MAQSRGPRKTGCLGYMELHILSYEGYKTSGNSIAIFNMYIHVSLYKKKYGKGPVLGRVKTGEHKPKPNKLTQWQEVTLV